MIRRIFMPGQRLDPKDAYFTKDMTMSAEEIVGDVLDDKIHQATICDRDEDKRDIPQILISKAVFEGYKRECPECNSIKEGFWEKIESKIRDINDDVYGGNIIWSE